MPNENRYARQGRTDYAERGRSRPSTKFDLDKLKRGDPSEIKSTAEKFQYLTQGQKDLIKHQAADSYSAIVKIAEMANSSQETGFKAQAHASNNFHEFCKQANNGYSTRDEKNDSYWVADRAHERTTRSLESQNESNNESYVKIALVTSLVVVAGVAMAVFGGEKKS